MICKLKLCARCTVLRASVCLRAVACAACSASYEVLQLYSCKCNRERNLLIILAIAGKGDRMGLIVR